MARNAKPRTEESSAAETEADTSSTNEPREDTRVVKYVGSADVKMLSVFDLQTAGINMPLGDLVWNSQNEHSVPVSYMDEPTLAYLRSQPDFRVV